MLQTGLAAVAGLILCPSWEVSAAGLGVFRGAHEKVREILGVLWEAGTMAQVPLRPLVRMSNAGPVTTTFTAQMRC